MEQPLVSVICLCYNHEKFVAEAALSVLNQTYKNIELIIADDASSDGSVAVINKLVTENPSVQILLLQENLGICRVFNRARVLAKGDYIIDFAADDVMLPDKIERQLDFFSRLDKSYGVVFTDAIYIDGNGNFLREHFKYLFQKKLIKLIPEGDVYADVLSTYFIASPSMMVRKGVFDLINGYDEKLTYEDFDFWVRSARSFKYAYLDQKLVKIRRTSNSMSRGWYRPGDPQLHSTYLVCKKAQGLNRSECDKMALVKRVKYELRQSIFSENHREAKLFYDLLMELGCPDSVDTIFYFVGNLHLPLSYLRRWYHRIRF